MKTLFLSMAVVILSFLTACSTSKSTSSNKDKSSSGTYDNMSTATDLTEYLKRIPGLNVAGEGANARVTIRGRSSLTNQEEPLFVIDGTPINGGLSQASSFVSVPNIKSVRVLTSPTETTMYGIRGGNGVIEIKLKNGS